MVQYNKVLAQTKEVRCASDSLGEVFHALLSANVSTFSARTLSLCRLGVLWGLFATRRDNLALAWRLSARLRSHP